MAECGLTQSAARVLDFWLGEIGPDGWYAGGAEIDARCREGFAPMWDEAMAGGWGLWLTSARGALAYVILTDQLPRNMFRGTAAAFASDPMARAAAKMAIDRGWDLALPAPERHFLYMPLEHSENLVDQDRAVRLFADRLPGEAEYLLHARAHREVIRRFGRFPTRNAALGRPDTPAEAAWLAAGGYAATLRALRDQGI